MAAGTESKRGLEVRRGRTDLVGDGLEEGHVGLAGYAATAAATVDAQERVAAVGVIGTG